MLSRLGQFTLPSLIIMVIAALWVIQGGSFGAGWLIAAMKIVAVGIVTQALLGMVSALY